VDRRGVSAPREQEAREQEGGDMSGSSAGRALRLPDAGERLRCAGCGNLTRFDVVRRATTREYWHQDLSGQVNVDDHETLDQTVVSITCRWCGRSDAIELAARPGSPTPD
jgi:hypothetical protein